MSDSLARRSSRANGRRVFALLAVAALHVLLIHTLLRQAAPFAVTLSSSVLEASIIVQEVAKAELPEPVTPQLIEARPVLPMPQIEVPETLPSANRAVTVPAPLSAPTSETAPVVVAAAPMTISTVEYLREPAPRYPPLSRRLREEGLVVLRVLIDPEGQAREIEVQRSSGYERLDRAACEAVMQARFKPHIANGRALPAYALVPIEFALDSSGRTARRG